LDNTAFFNNALTVQNIISRVTGGQFSDINGIIQANGTANLFLINPSGIVFGPNASLDIGGSFFASTADSINFADGGIFSAADPTNGTILSFNVPLGVQMGTNPGDIIIQGSGNSLALDPRNFEIFRGFRPPGLAVKPGQTLTLVGGNIQLEGGNLTAEQGRIRLGSFSNGQINLTDAEGKPKFTNVNSINYGDIRFIRASSADVSGNGSGNVEISGKNLILAQGSVILAETLGNGSGGQVNITTTESIQASGVKPPFVPPFGLAIFSGIFTEVASSSANNAQGGNMTLETGQLVVTNGAQIGVNTFGPGQAGQLKIDANSVLLSSGSPLGPSGIFVAVAPGPLASGQGGILKLTANQLQMTSGAQIFGGTFGAGNAPPASEAHQINVREIDISGNAPNGSPTGILMNVETDATGQGGNLNLEANTLQLTDGGQISSVTFGSGNAGILNIKANTINVVGGTQTTPSGIFSGVGGFNVTSSGNPITGNGGNIQVQANGITLTDGGVISASTSSLGNSGTVTVKAQNIEVSGGTAQGASGIFSTVLPNAQGQGGQVTLETNTLTMTDGGQIAVSTAGFGRGGNLSVTAESVQLTGGSVFGASGLFANAIIGNGDGGNVDLVTNQLTVKDGATINVSNFPSRSGNSSPGQGAPGNLNIEAQSVFLSNQGSLTAETLAGSEGNIIVSSRNIRLQGNSSISTNAQGEGKGGSITFDTNNLALQNSIISSNAPGEGAAGNITVNSLSQNPDISLNQSTISATGNQGNLELNGRNIQLNQGSALTTEGNQGNILVNGQNLQLKQDSSISTNAQGDNSGGSINLNLDNLNLDNSIISSNAPGQGAAGNIIVSSLSQNPDISLNQSTISATGNQGNLELNGRNIQLNQGSALTAEGNQGNILVNGQNLQLKQDSSISTNAQGDNSGGSINLNLDNLNLDNSIITSNAPGQGAAGNITVNSLSQNPDISLNQSTISATGNQGNLELNGRNIQLNQGSALTAEGNQGNILVNGQNLQLKQESSISSNAQGDNSGGNVIVITDDKVILKDNSSITTNAQGNGSGGNIEVLTGTMTIETGSQISANASAGAAGNVSILATSPATLTLNQGTITATGGQGNIILTSPIIILRNGSLISTNGLGDSPGGNIIITTNFLFVIPTENSDITANAQQALGGRVIITTRGMFGIAIRDALTPLSDITVSSELGPDFSGVVIIQNLDGDPTAGFVKLPSDVIDASSRIVAGCAVDRGNVFAFTGRGGVPANPSQLLSRPMSWQDLRELPEQPTVAQINETNQISTEPSSSPYCYYQSFP
jgi:filamentous hemagglutinin family protein